VDDPPISEVLPGLYRAVLDAVAGLEYRKHRTDAASIRAEATRVYSRAWNADAAKRLQGLRTRADRIAGVRPRTQYKIVTEPLGRVPDLERRTA
jgi:hypothetical protein